MDELSPFCGAIRRRRDPFYTSMASRLARGELIVDEEAVEAPKPGYFVDIGPDQVIKNTSRGWYKFTFRKPPTRRSRLAAHLRTYRRDYLSAALVLVLIYLISKV